MNRGKLLVNLAKERLKLEENKENNFDGLLSDKDNDEEENWISRLTGEEKNDAISGLLSDEELNGEETNGISTLTVEEEFVPGQNRNDSVSSYRILDIEEQNWIPALIVGEENDVVPDPDLTFNRSDIKVIAITHNNELTFESNSNSAAWIPDSDCNDESVTEMSETNNKNITEMSEYIDLNGTGLSENMNENATEISENIDRNLTEMSENIDMNVTGISENMIENATELSENIDQDVTEICENTDEYVTETISENGNDNPNNSDGETKNPRKRLRSESTWRRNDIKMKRNKGVDYVNWRGNKVEKRNMKETCTNCRFKCPSKFTNEERVGIFEAFWNLGNIDRQRDYIINNIKEKPKQRIRVRDIPESNDDNDEDDPTDAAKDKKHSRRAMSYFYYLKHDVKEDRVCQTYFLNTLSISHQMVKTAFKKKNAISNTVSGDKRGRVQRNSLLPEEMKQSIIEHIKSFPKVESHYCRKNSEREYLECNLNVCKMYELYIEYCREKKFKPAKLSMYRHVFNTKFNLGFFQPKNDLCDLCEKFKNSNKEEKDELQEVMDAHLKNKMLARESKEKAKERCQTDNLLFAAVFDLQQVLQSPHLAVSQLYYRRKLSVYNLSVYDIHHKKGFCFMWDETKGQRGSNEIASCVAKMIEKKAEEGKKEMLFFSDNCGGQNLNRNIVIMYLFLAVNLQIKITHCFLEKGHTQNECDSVHSRVEKASKNVPIYVPDQWYILARTACKKAPYDVIEMEEFLDFAEMRQECSNNMDKDENGDKVKWQKVRVIMVDANEPTKISIKYGYNEDFLKIDIHSRTRKHRAPLLNRQPNEIGGNISISYEKFKDLEYLCTSKTIPASYHHFYNNIKHLNK